MTRQREAAAVYVHPDELRPWEDNPRINDDAVEPVAQSIAQFGFASPIVARTDGTIIAGHTRWTAARRLGLERVPVRFMDLTDAQFRALALADNKLGEIAEWDGDLLEETFVALRDCDAELIAATGWEDEMGEYLRALDGQIDDPGESASGGGASLQFRVLVEVDSESAQSAMIQRLESEGFKCQPLMS